MPSRGVCFQKKRSCSQQVCQPPNFVCGKTRHLNCGSNIGLAFTKLRCVGTCFAPRVIQMQQWRDGTDDCKMVRLVSDPSWLVQDNGECSPIDEDSFKDSYNLIRRIHDTYLLVNIVDNVSSWHTCTQSPPSFFVMRVLRSHAPPHCRRTPRTTQTKIATFSRSSAALSTAS